MKTLFIDLASNAQLLAVADDKRTLASRTSDKRFDEQELMPLIESILKDAGSSLQDLKRIACVTGPGGFMSLRVGAALVNALAYSLKIPATGIHVSDVWATRMIAPEKIRNPKSEIRNFIWVHSTKRTHIF